MKKKWTIEYYETASGETPAYDFINNLPAKMRAKAFKGLELLEEFGTAIKMPYSRYELEKALNYKVDFERRFAE